MKFSLGLLLLLACGATLVVADQDYDGYRIYEVTPSNDEQASILHQLSFEGFDFIGQSRLLGQPSRVIVSPGQLEKFLKLLKDHEMTHSLFNSNLGASISEEFVQMQMQRLLNPITGKGRLSTERYYSHEEIINYIDDLAQRYPKRVYVKTVGWSYEKRVLKTITITNGDGKAGKKTDLHGWWLPCQRVDIPSCCSLCY